MSGEIVFGDARVEILDKGLAPIGHYSIWNSCVERRELQPNAWVVQANTQYLPHIEAQSVWQQWRSGRPTEKGMWSEIGVGQREGWLEVAMLSRHGSLPIAGDQVVIEGEHIFDLASFFCAVGEAFCGPGGYFGSSFHGLDDCLRTSGLAKPVHLTWRNSDVAQASLSRRSLNADDLATYMEIIQGTFRRCGVEVVLA